MKTKDLREIRRLLVDIDMVNGFIKEGALHDPRIAEILNEHIRLIKLFSADDSDYEFFRDCHTMDSVEFKYFPVHCLEGTSESEIVDELLPYTIGRRVYKKNSTSGIFAPGYLDDIDKMVNLEEIVYIGCCTDLCDTNIVIPQRNYFNQHNRDVRIIVPENAIATYDAPGHDAREYTDMTIKLMKLNGITVVPRYERRG